MQLAVVKFITLFGSLLITSEVLAQGFVSGVVVNRNGQPLANAGFRITGYAPSSPGVDIMYTDYPEMRRTDKEGRFEIMWTRPHPAIALVFDHPEYAPVFLSEVKTANSPLRIVLEEGKLLKGRLVDENGVPLGHASIKVELLGLYWQRDSTDENGQFQFRISEPPQKRWWTLACAGKSFKVPYDQVRPETVFELHANIQMVTKAEPGGEANRSQAIGSETNQPSAAAGSRR